MSECKLVNLAICKRAREVDKLVKSLVDKIGFNVLEAAGVGLGHPIRDINLESNDGLIYKLEVGNLSADEVIKLVEFIEGNVEL